GLTLVIAKGPAVLVEVDLVGLAIDVPGEVLSRPTEFEQCLLEVATFAGMDGDRVIVDALAEHACDLLGPSDLLQYGPIRRGQHQAVGRVLLEAKAPVAIHGLGDIDEQGMTNGVTAEGQQDVDDLLGVVAGCSGVPES